MPEAFTIYDRAGVKVNGRYVVHSTQVRVAYIGGGNQVVSWLGGGSDFTSAVIPGTRLLAVSWSTAVPSNDTSDLDFMRQFVDTEKVRVDVVLFGSRVVLTSKGWIHEPTIESSIGTTTVYSCSYIGSPQVFQ